MYVVVPNQTKINLTSPPAITASHETSHTTTPSYQLEAGTEMCSYDYMSCIGLLLLLGVVVFWYFRSPDELEKK